MSLIRVQHGIEQQWSILFRIQCVLPISHFLHCRPHHHCGLPHLVIYLQTSMASICKNFPDLSILMKLQDSSQLRSNTALHIASLTRTLAAGTRSWFQWMILSRGVLSWWDFKKLQENSGEILFIYLFISKWEILNLNLQTYGSKSCLGAPGCLIS